MDAPWRLHQTSLRAPPQRPQLQLARAQHAWSSASRVRRWRCPSPCVATTPAAAARSAAMWIGFGGARALEPAFLELRSLWQRAALLPGCLRVASGFPEQFQVEFFGGLCRLLADFMRCASDADELAVARCWGSRVWGVVLRLLRVLPHDAISSQVKSSQNARHWSLIGGWWFWWTLCVFSATKPTPRPQRSRQGRSGLDCPSS